LVFVLIAFSFVLDDIVWGKTAGEVLAQFQGLQGGARETQLAEAAKKKAR